MKRPTVVAAVLVALGSATPMDGQQTQGQGAAPPRPRTEAEARAAADWNRAQRAEQREKTGKPAELIPSYAKAAIGPVPELA